MDVANDGGISSPTSRSHANICIAERVTEEEDGSRSNAPFRCDKACHVKKFSLILENLRKRKVDPLLH